LYFVQVQNVRAMRRTLPIATAVLAAAALAVAIFGFLDETATLVPKEWPLPAAVQGRLTTVLFHSAGLEGGREYSSPYVNIGFQRTGSAEITSGRVLMVVDATPST
jgi:hypothetical protein